jgi:hypothetical protein
MEIKDIQDELFRLEYPYLHPGSDPDIERYCYLHGVGQGRAALNLYQNRLMPRYPDKTLRTALLHSYRRRDPLFSRLLAVGYRRLAERALGRIRGVLDQISEKIRAHNKQEVYSTVRTVEGILRFFPQGQYEALSALDRMYRYARVLNHQVDPLAEAVELVRAYVTRSLPVLELERDRRRREQEAVSAAKPLVDFSTVEFSGTDLARIEIPQVLSRVEDQTLAYCAKYWNLINDNAFEQILFLYSRKYGKKNHAVYLTIRRGRKADYRDEEILSSVMSILVTGYYYSILGDRYLQRNWQSIKIAMDRAAIRPVPSKAVAPKPAVPKAATEPVPESVPPKTAKPPMAASKPAPPKVPVQKPVPEPVVKAAASPKVTVPKAAKLPKAAAKPAPKSASRTGRPGPPQPAGGSVSDRLRKLSGRGYDLYQDRFLAHARPAIRRILGRGRGIFFSLPEKAEDLVYHYLRDHYADPYMNWPESEEYRRLTEQGFKLPSLDPVIDECFRKISKE